jgi:hypothetical protein
LRGKVGEAGEGGDELLGVCVLGRAEDLGGGAAFDDFSGVQNGDAMTERGDGQQIVGYIKDAHAEFAVELRKQA